MLLRFLLALLWCLPITLGRPLLWLLRLMLGRSLLRLLRLMLGGRPPLRGRCLDGRAPLNVYATRLRRLSAWSR